MGYWDRKAIVLHGEMVEIANKKNKEAVKDLMEHGENITDEEKERMIGFANGVIEFMKTLDDSFWVEMAKGNYLPSRIMSIVGTKYKESIGDDCEWLRLILARNKRK